MGSSWKLRAMYVPEKINPFCTGCHSKDKINAARHRDVLTGKDDDRIKQFGHDTLSVFGIGNEYDTKHWRHIFRQLISRNLLAVDVEGHGSLHLTETCRAVLRGEQTLQLRKLSKQAKAAFGMDFELLA